ncbi:MULTISPECIES: hypothetical protein [unclassified Streptomyces]|nr:MULTISPECIES: hypothetical protein [unclassified Streptomyces]
MTNVTGETASPASRVYRRPFEEENLEANAGRHPPASTSAPRT